MIFNPAVINLIKKEDEQLNIDSLFSLIQSVVFFFFTAFQLLWKNTLWKKAMIAMQKEKNDGFVIKLSVGCYTLPANMTQ